MSYYQQGMGLPLGPYSPNYALDPNIDPSLQDVESTLRVQQAPSLPASAAFPPAPWSQTNTVSMPSVARYGATGATARTPLGPIANSMPPGSMLPPWDGTYAPQPPQQPFPAPNSNSSATAANDASVHRYNANNHAFLDGMPQYIPEAPRATINGSSGFLQPTDPAVQNRAITPLSTRAIPQVLSPPRSLDPDGSDKGSSDAEKDTDDPDEEPSSDEEDNTTARGGDLDRQANTWAARNSGRKILSPKKRTKKHLTPAEKVTREIAKNQRDAKMKKLAEDIDEFMKEQLSKMKEVAGANNVTLEKVRGQVIAETHYKNRREPAIHNAIMHAKADEFNKGLLPGQKLTREELKQKIDEENRTLSKAEKKKLCEQLREHRTHKVTGMRANNAASARDVLCVTDNWIRQADNLSLRTGAYSFFFATPGHVNDRAAPTHYGSDGALLFVKEVLGMDPDELSRKFHIWACSRDENTEDRDNLVNVRQQCVRDILSGLHNILNKKKVTMNYVNYDDAIVNARHVMLKGWPKGVKFANPSDIAVIKDLRTLRDDLKSGKCFWYKATAREVEKHMDEVQRRRDLGETIGKPRKKRGPNKRKKATPEDGASENEENEPPAKENEPPRKRTKKARARKAKTTSAPVIVDSSSEEG